MYFANRAQAGRQLADKLVTKYRYENCTVVALGDGGVVVGAQIAAQLHCSINMLVYEEIKLPLEPKALSGIAYNGAYSFNPYYSHSEIDEFLSEYYQFVEVEKLRKLSGMQRLIGRGGVTRRDLLKGHSIILVSDGLQDTFALDIAVEFLKPIAYSKLVVATPLAGVDVIDSLHVFADDLYCLSVTDGIFDTNHYYDNNDMPSHEKIIEIIENIIWRWR